MCGFGNGIRSCGLEREDEELSRVLEEGFSESALLGTRDAVRG